MILSAGDFARHSNDAAMKLGIGRTLSVTETSARVRFRSGERTFLLSYLERTEAPAVRDSSGLPVETVAVATSSYVSFLERLRGRRHAIWLTVNLMRRGGIERGMSEYFSWSGEPLPDSAVVLVDRRTPSGERFPEREWKFSCLMQDGDEYPCPLVRMGSTGRSHVTDPACGLVSGRTLIVYHSCLVEQLVRSGLRAAAY